MSLLSGLTVDNDIKQEQDVIGGFGPLESNIYESTITMAFLQKSRSGALGFHVHFETDDKKTYRQTLYVTSGDAKGNKNYYVNQKGEKHYLPGFDHADAMCLLTVGKGLAEMDTEDKVVNVYSPEAGKEVPTTVPVLTELLGKKVLVGLKKQIEDKRAKNPNTNQYEPTGETRESNEIDKIFRAEDGFTTAEIRAQADKAAFVHTWKEKWEGKTHDKSTKSAGGSGAQSGAPGQANAGGGQAPRKSLFANPTN